ncbi:transcriptional regulator of arginine metabolism [Enterococcus sp. PF1-24]|uniref:arginine repressor n=1 Tax=unclassified Enterococcus TaxID=2608891 RepID=UPI002474061B|nr:MULTISPECIES: arginine repressor [unclassified Enterococcus]MDH6365065.1 transcriptional regulator of arginine metabolism [Enterococcus sp. PFB1-1]MDH6402162.1 transcriptional regulator of arginine metabolism [Enterococcus sp. PF1-24]
MKKSERQQLIKQIILQNVIGSQEELLSKLEEAGVKATQATISRDVRELSIVKNHDNNGNVRYGIFAQQTEANKEDKLAASVKDHVLRIEQVQFTVIIHTTLASANVVANWMDDISYPEIAGTVAGEDTILIICRSEAEATSFAAKIQEMRDFS